jgi:hypothetical protein
MARAWSERAVGPRGWWNVGGPREGRGIGAAAGRWNLGGARGRRNLDRGRTRRAVRRRLRRGGLGLAASLPRQPGLLLAGAWPLGLDGRNSFDRGGNQDDGAGANDAAEHDQRGSGGETHVRAQEPSPSTPAAPRATAGPIAYRAVARLWPSTGLLGRGAADYPAGAPPVGLVNTSATPAASPGSRNGRVAVDRRRIGRGIDRQGHLGAAMNRRPCSTEGEAGDPVCDLAHTRGCLPHAITARRASFRRAA